MILIVIDLLNLLVLNMLVILSYKVNTIDTYSNYLALSLIL